MTISKTHNNMLFMLASLACGQKDNSSVNPMVKHRIPIAAVSDVSDDETSSTTSASPSKEIVVARRRRRPLKKRRPYDDYQPKSSSLQILGSSIKPRKSLLETSIEIGNLIHKPRVPAHVESRHERPAVPQAQNNSNNDAAPQAVDEEMPTLVSDDAAWKQVHSPLDLPRFLPCPAMALKNVKSINLTIEER